MVFPTNEIKLKKASQQLIFEIEGLGKRAKAALDDTKYNNVVNLRYACIRLGQKFSDLADSGLPAETLGPIVAAEWGFDWASVASSFTELKDTVIPGFVGVVEANKTEILARDFGANNVESVAISPIIISALQVEIQKIIDLIPV